MASGSVTISLVLVCNMGRERINLYLPVWNQNSHHIHFIPEDRETIIALITTATEIFITGDASLYF